jgi:hypothetical protein
VTHKPEKPTFKRTSHVPRLPPKLVEMARLGKCIAFVGAGLSVAAHAPTWQELMTRLVDFGISEGKLVPSDKQPLLDALRSRGPEIVADALRKAISDERVSEFMDAQFRNLSQTPVHDALVGTPCPYRLVNRRW